ncbi:zinc finger protein 511 [Hydra vulgaris]|nr:zinc finger protein 511 [Hydra vulgaris]
MLQIKRRFPPDDPFFEDGDILFTRLIRTVDETVDSITESLDAVNISSFKCSIKGCSKIFSSPFLYNQHFDLLHRYVCHSCNRHLPSNHLLELHLMETHDTYFQACLEKGLEVYQCFLQSCRMKFVNEETRKKHLVDIHHYPADFKFSVSKRNLKENQTKKLMKINLDNNSESAMEIDIEKITDKNTKILSFNDDVPIKSSNDKIDNEFHRQCTTDKKLSKRCQVDNELTSEENKIEKVTNDCGLNNKFQNKQKTTAKLPKSVSFGRGRQRAFIK